MNLYNLDTYNRVLFYADNLIVKPLSKFSFDEYDKKQFTDLICENINDDNKFTQQLASDFGHYSKNWKVDWHWIAHHILSDFHNLRRATEIENMMFSQERLVYKESLENKNPEYNELYLTDPINPDSQPKIFKLKELIDNGTNIGLRKAQWKPTIGILISDFMNIILTMTKLMRKKSLIIWITVL